MQDLADSADLICHNNTPCMLRWNEVQADPQEAGYRASLTHLGALSGAYENYYNDYNDGDGSNYEGTVYGAEFHEVHHKPPYYESMIMERVEAPWLAQGQEWTFMNRTKVKNEPVVKTYKDLKLSPVSNENNELYKPMINTATMKRPKIYTPCNKCTNNNYGSCDINELVENFEQSSELDIRSPLDTNVGVGFVWRVMLVIFAFMVIYYVLKMKKE